MHLLPSPEASGEGVGVMARLSNVQNEVELMKVRWTKGSVRFRITPSELEMLLRGEPVSEHLDIGSSSGVHSGWSAILLGKEPTSRLTFEAGSLRCDVSVSDCERLAVPDTEGIYFQMDDGVNSAVTESTPESNDVTGQNPALRWFIEKDFPCVHPRASKAAEPVTEAFVPPAGFKARKLPGC